MHSRYKKIFAFILMVLWMGVIFYFSAQVATDSSAQSGGVVEIIKGFLEKISPPAKEFDIAFWDAFETLLRKIAHGFIYFILGILCSNFIIKCNIKRKITISLAICFLYAVSDEIHQIFVAGRSGQIGDVIIDSFGSVVGIVVFFVVSKWFFSRRKA